MIGIGMSMNQRQQGVVGNAPPPPPPPPTSHVFVVAGQSNSAGRAADDGADFPAGVFEWRSDATWGAIGSRLSHGPNEPEAIARPLAGANFSFARSFATSYLAENPGVTLRLIGAGRGGTGFADNEWNPGDPIYAQAVTRVNAALAAAPAGSVLKGILWHQGEADAKTPAARAAYASALNTFVTAFRSDITWATASTPIVLGGHFTNVTGTYDTSTIQNAVQAMPNTLPFTGYADPSSPVEATLADGLHLDAASTTRFGAQYHAGFKAAETNTSLSQSGVITTGALARHDLPASLSAQVNTVALGTPAADRLIVLALVVRGNYGAQPTSLQVGGVEMTRMGFPSSGNSMCGLTLFTGRVPDGTTGDVAVTFDSLPRNDQLGFVLLPVYGARAALANPAGFARKLETGTSHTALSVDVDAAAGDLVFAASGSLSGPATTGSFDLDTHSTAPIAAANMAIHAGWSIQPTGQPPTRTITCSYAAPVQVPSLSALVLRPT